MATLLRGDAIAGVLGGISDCGTDIDIFEGNKRPLQELSDTNRATRPGRATRAAPLWHGRITVERFAEIHDGARTFS